MVNLELLTAAIAFSVGFIAGVVCMWMAGKSVDVLEDMAG